MTQESQYRQAETIVEELRDVLGVFPGYRTLHADGRLYRGTFCAYPNAREYSCASHLAGSATPVTVRFSKGGGNPYALFNATVGLATRFYLPNGRFTNLVTMSQKLFFANSIEQLLGLASSMKPTEPGAGPNKEGLHAFLANNPNSAEVFRIRGETEAPTSFAHAGFSSIHAFYYVDAHGNRTPARCHWVPVAGVEFQPVAALADKDPEILFTEFDNRLAKGQVEFEMALELAEPGDPLNDPTVLWPQDREMVRIGRMVVTGPITVEEIGDPVMNHDPTVLTDGIEATDDPILEIRRGVYEVSAAGRTGGWKSCPFARQ